MWGIAAKPIGHICRRLTRVGANYRDTRWKCNDCSRVYTVSWDKSVYFKDAVAKVTVMKILKSD